MIRITLLLKILVLVTACGGGGKGNVTNETPTASIANQNSNANTQSSDSTSNSTPSPPSQGITNVEAHRFLRQASFGPTLLTIAEVKETGYSTWIDNQLTLPWTSHLDYFDSLPEPENNQQGQENRIDGWLSAAVTSEDQLRQRVAYALSQIMVVSQNGGLFEHPDGLAYYYDLLVKNAFGNYRDLLEAVTLSPAMGVYLSMLGNEKPDSERNIRPDENFAREAMQLFSIGLIQLNIDGSKKLNANGQSIPTYSQEVIEGFAHVYTGWTHGGSESFYNRSNNMRVQMQAFEELHDKNQKLLLNNVILPSNQSAEKDLQQALDNISGHPNVPTFISRRLIQRLVTANPSPKYIERVASVFVDDGSGQRGNLGAVVKAILLDQEARKPPNPETAGKVTEPVIRLINLWRAFDAVSASGRYQQNLNWHFGQGPLQAPSVFNFYSPDYSPPGELRDLSLFSPEMQIINEASSAIANNELLNSTFWHTSERINELDPERVYINIDPEIKLAEDSLLLTEAVALKLLGGNISYNLKRETISMVEKWEEPQRRVSEAIHHILTSVEFAVLP